MWLLGISLVLFFSLFVMAVIRRPRFKLFKHQETFIKEAEKRRFCFRMVDGLLIPFDTKCGFSPNLLWEPCTREYGHEGPCAHPLAT